MEPPIQTHGVCLCLVQECGVSKTAHQKKDAKMFKNNMRNDDDNNDGISVGSTSSVGGDIFIGFNIISACVLAKHRNNTTSRQNISVTQMQCMVVETHCDTLPKSNENNSNRFGDACSRAQSKSMFT